MKLSSRLRKFIIDTTGYWIYKKSDLPVGSDLIIDLKSKIKSPLNTIFDVGANIGQTAVFFNENFRNANVFSFEPVKNTFNQLKDNVSHLKMVNCFHFALGEKDEMAEIKIFPDSSSVLNTLNKNAQNNNGNNIEKITVVKGDTFCFENKISEIDLLKIDTEGYELEVLNGFSNMIKEGKIKLIYCETGFSLQNSRNTYLNDLITFANNNGFQLYGIYEIRNKEIKNSKNFANVLFVNKNVL